MAEINLQCNNLSQIHSNVLFRLKIAWQVEGRAELSLAKIHQEMSELLDKEKRENFRGSRKLSQAQEKCALKMKQRNKKRMMRA